MGESTSKHSGLWNRLLLSILILLGVCLIGIFGFILLFGWKPIDAVYMVVITIFGVGYGEVEPVDHTSARIFVILLIVLGNSSALYVVGELVRTLTQGEIAKALGDMKESRRVEGIKHHTIICGYGRIGQILAKELAAHDHPFVIVDTDKERIAQAHESGFLTVEGSATEETTLITAGIARADVLATVLPQDTLNVFITLTARNLNKDIRIIARGEQPMTEKKLRQAGATEVILPSSIGGLRIAHSITRPALMDFVGGKDGYGGADFHHLGIEIHELTLERHSYLEGWRIGEIQRKAGGELMVLAIRRGNGDIIRENFSQLSIELGDSLIVMGRLGGVPTFLKQEIADTELI
jgi:voltage-gated potassium channel